MLKKSLFFLLTFIFAIAIVYMDVKTTKTYHFEASHLQGQIGTIKGTTRYISDENKRGFLSYGPYIKLKKGSYKVTISYLSKDAKNAKYDIVTNGAKTIVKQGNLEANNFSKNIINHIKVDNSEQNWEVRIWYDAKGSLTLKHITITREFSSVEFKLTLIYFAFLLLIFLFFRYLLRFSKEITFFVLLLLFFVCLLFVFDAYMNFYKYKEMTYKEMPLTKDIFKYYLNQSIKSEYVKLNATKLKKDENIESFYLFINKKDLDILNSDLPLSGMDRYIDARLKINDNKPTKVKLRYRGGSAWNYLYDRKSIKIKLKKDNLYNMMKKINFSVLYSLDMLIEPITQKAASKVGALAPEVKIVRMYINGKYQGLYLYLDQVDESFLRKHKIMPGSIYDGDYSVKVKHSNYIGKNGIAKLWYDSSMWEKKASRNKEQKANREDINLLIKAVNKYNDKEFYNFAQTYISDQYYTYMALDVLWGTHHHDYFHNHKIYFDPYKGKYTAISWDVRFWINNTIKDNSYYPLIQRVAQNPLLEYKRDKELYRIMKIITPTYIKIQMDQEKKKILNSFKSDKNAKQIAINNKLFPWKQTHNPPQLIVATTKDVEKVFNRYLNNFTNRYKYLDKMLNNATVNYSILKEKDFVKVTLSIDGNSPVKLHYKDTTIYSARKLLPKNALGLDKGGYGDTHLKPIPQYYSFLIPKKEFNEDMFSSGVNAITFKKIKFTKVNKIDIKPVDAIRANQLIQPKVKSIILKGRVKVTKTLVFDKFTQVIIKPNTTFIISPNKSIYFYAKVTALGTKNKPIKFTALDAKKPWGLVALQGKATSGSKFEYVSFKNGSIDTRHLIHYTAQFNIHDTDNFEVKNCFIGKNFKGDDAMHIAYSTGMVDSCTFDGARSDALDIDISKVTITNNTFKNAGNDGLDIMTTSMQASKNTFTDTGDKGISVGEWSDANITDSTFTRTFIGIAIKDKSKVIAHNLLFINSKDKAIYLYNKNKRYDTGGYLKATNIKYIGNDKVTADAKSKVEIDE